MVRLATSIVAVTILAGTALAQGVYYDEQFERSISDSENLEARSEAVLSDYLAAREEIEEQYGRDITDNERRELFEVLEEREPQLFSLIKTGIKFGIKQGIKSKNGKQQEENLHVPINIDKLGGLPPTQRSLEEDEELFGRDYDDVEFEARDFDDLEEYEVRDFEELEEREPFNFGALTRLGAKAFRKGHGYSHGGTGGRFGHGAFHFHHNQQQQQQQPSDVQQRRSFDELD